jgi:hypothetical protein
LRFSNELNKKEEQLNLVNKMQINDAEQFCSSWLAAWTGNRPLALIEFYSEDCLYLDPANPDGLRGHSEVLPYFIKLLAANPTWEWKVDEIFLIQNGFVLKWKASIPVGNTVIQVSGLDIVELIEDKISRNEVFFDRTKWLKVLRES